MDAHSILTNTQKLFASELVDGVLGQCNDIKVLSLDCFDTLLWRKTATPTDVFYELQHRHYFKRLGMSAIQRVHAESHARKINLIRTGSSEVQLQDIYSAYSASLSADDISGLIHDELTLEKETCYGFPATLELIEKAHARGLKIIIVSDTYFSEPQLCSLLKATLPESVLQKISRIFCSSEYKLSKSNGLFKQVMKSIEPDANAILHVGDNYHSDIIAAQRCNIRSAHLIHQHESIDELMRLQTTAISILDPEFRRSKPLNLPFRSVFAQRDFSAINPDKLIGYAALGTIIYPFARFICDELSALQAQGKNVKVVFLLRDAYLPAKVCEAIVGSPVGKCIRVSRFTAYAASFRNQADIDSYLVTILNANSLDSIAKQLLLPEKIATKIVNDSLKTPDPTLTFLRNIQQQKIVDTIIKNSTLYRARFKKYLENQLDMKPDDTLMMVDLGYSGTAQQRLEPIFREEWGVTVLGRYLIQLTVPEWNHSRRGLIDPSWCDDRTMHMLVSYIALLEQLCTTNDKSVIDYDVNGQPIYSDTILDTIQHQKLALIQQNCVQFARDAERTFTLMGNFPNIDDLRTTALGELSRLLFLPTRQEISFLKEFKFDLNLGTKDVFEVFNIEKGLTSLRRRGIFSIFMEKNASSFRPNVPAEFRSAGIEFAFTLMTQHRYGVDIKITDSTLRHQAINAILIKGAQNSQVTLEAQATYDGYFSVLIPMGVGDFQLGLLLGQQYQWLQVESAEMIPMEYALTTKETQYAQDYSSKLIYNDMRLHGKNIYESLSKSSFMMIIPEATSTKYLFRFVFRPIEIYSPRLAAGTVVMGDCQGGAVPP